MIADPKIGRSAISSTEPLLGQLRLFLAGMSEDFRIVISEQPELVLSARKLPSEPSVIVLPPS